MGSVSAPARAWRAQAIKRRKQIWEALHPEEIQVRQIDAPEIGYGKPPPQQKAFAASTAEVTGENVRGIQRHLARADALGDDLERITGTSITPARVEGTLPAGRHLRFPQVSRSGALLVLAVLVQKTRPIGYTVATRAEKTKTALCFT